MIYYLREKKFVEYYRRLLLEQEKKFLIVGIGINTNIDPNNSSFSSTTLKQITNKNIDNKKLFIMIKNKYEKFLFKIKRYSFVELKKFTKKV